MKYLKLINESIIDQIQQKKKMIWDKLELGEFNESIDDILQIMELDFDFDWENGGTEISIEYKINVTRRKSINISTIDRMMPPSYPNSELDRIIRILESAKSIKAKTDRKIKTILTEENGDDFTSMVSSLKSRCESESIDLKISSIFPMSIKWDLEKSLEKHFGVGEIDFDLIKNLKFSSWRGMPNLHLNLQFEKNIPIDSIKMSEDPFHKLPQSVIDDFKEFAKRYRMSNQDKEHLLKIIDKGFEKKG